MISILEILGNVLEGWRLITNDREIFYELYEFIKIYLVYDEDIVTSTVLDFIFILSLVTVFT